MSVPHRSEQAWNTIARWGVPSVPNPLVKDWRNTCQAEGASLRSYAPLKAAWLAGGSEHLKADVLKTEQKASAGNRTSRKKYGRSARSALPLRRRPFAGNRKAEKPLTSAFYGFPCAPRSLSVPFARPDMLAENAVERRLCSPQYRSNIPDCSSLRGNVHVLCMKRACL